LYVGLLQIEAQHRIWAFYEVVTYSTVVFHYIYTRSKTAGTSSLLWRLQRPVSNRLESHDNETVSQLTCPLPHQYCKWYRASEICCIIGCWKSNQICRAWPPEQFCVSDHGNNSYSDQLLGRQHYAEKSRFHSPLHR